MVFRHFYSECMAHIASTDENPLNKATCIASAVNLWAASQLLFPPHPEAEQNLLSTSEA